MIQEEIDDRHRQAMIKGAARGVSVGAKTVVKTTEEHPVATTALAAIPVA
jgi:hypothetical protein